MARTTPALMLMYGKEASNRKQEIDRQHYTIPNQRAKEGGDSDRGANIDFGGSWQRQDEYDDREDCLHGGEWHIKV